MIPAFFLGGTISVAGHGSGDDQRLDGATLAAGLPGVEVHDFRRTSGGSLTHQDLQELHAKAAAAAGEGVVVVQGTDTIEETSYLLDLLWDDDRPLVVTGAMRQPAMPGADGPANLAAAAAVAAAPDFRGLGVLVVLNDEVHAARFVRKGHATSPATFTSPDAGPVGLLVEGRPVRLVSLPRRGTYAPGPIGARVPLLTATLGESSEVVAELGAGAAGLVVSGFGAGHVPASWAPALGELAARIPVVLASRTGGGPVLTATYWAPGSEHDLLSRGLVPAGLLHPLKARLLLQVCLACGYDVAAVRSAFAEAGGLA